MDSPRTPGNRERGSFAAVVTSESIASLNNCCSAHASIHSHSSALLSRRIVLHEYVMYFSHPRRTLIVKAVIRCHFPHAVTLGTVKEAIFKLYKFILFSLQF